MSISQDRESQGWPVLHPGMKAGQPDRGVHLCADNCASPAACSVVCHHITIPGRPALHIQHYRAGKINHFPGPPSNRRENTVLFQDNNLGAKVYLHPSSILLFSIPAQYIDCTSKKSFYLHLGAK